MSEQPPIESDPKPPSLEPSEEIEELLCMSLDEAQLDRADRERQEFEEKLPTFRERRQLFEDLRRLMMITSYIEVLTADPTRAPEDVQVFGVDRFVELLQQEQARLNGMYDVDLGPVDVTGRRPDDQWAVNNLALAYPEYRNARERLSANQERFSEAGVEVSSSYEFTGDWPQGAAGDTFTVTELNLFNGLVSGKLSGAADPNLEVSVSIDSLGQKIEN